MFTEISFTLIAFIQSILQIIIRGITNGSKWQYLFFNYTCIKKLHKNQSIKKETMENDKDIEMQ